MEMDLGTNHLCQTLGRMWGFWYFKDIISKFWQLWKHLLIESNENVDRTNIKDSFELLPFSCNLVSAFLLQNFLVIFKNVHIPTICQAE